MTHIHHIHHIHHLNLTDTEYAALAAKGYDPQLEQLMIDGCLYSQFKKLGFSLGSTLKGNVKA